MTTGGSGNTVDSRDVKLAPDSFLRRAGVLFMMSGATWFLYCALMLWSLTLVIGAFNPEVPEDSIAGGMAAFRPAILAASLAGFALALGIWHMTRARLSATVERNANIRTVVYGVSRDTRLMGTVASVFLVVFGTLGLISFFELADATLETITIALILFMVASCVLLVASQVFMAFTRDLARDTSNHVSVNGSWFSDYAIANVLALALVPLSQLLRASAASPTSNDLYHELLHGAMYTQLLVVPIMGFIVWGWFVSQSSRFCVSRTVLMPHPTLVSPSETEAESGRPAHSSPSTPTGDRSATAIHVIPTTPGPQGRVVVEANAGARNPLDDLADRSWVLRLESRLLELETVTRNQQDAIAALERQVHDVARESSTHRGSEPSSSLDATEAEPRRPRGDLS